MLAEAAEAALRGFKAAIREGYTGTAFRVEMAEVLAGQRRLQDAAVGTVKEADDPEVRAAVETLEGRAIRASRSTLASLFRAATMGANCG